MSNTTYGQTAELLPELLTQFYHAERIDIIVSFVMKSGISLLERSIRQAVASGVPVRVLTSTYMNITDPTALSLLRDCLGEMGDLRLYNGSSNSFHPKAYIFHGNKTNCIYVGSSNVSKSALTNGVEWNYKIEKAQDNTAFTEFADRFEYLFNQEAIALTDDILKDYRDFYVKTTVGNYPINQHFKKYQKAGHIYELLPPDLSGAAEAQQLFHPNDAQLEALIELKRTRVEGNNKALVIAATGLGKTFLAAFDAEQYERVLFIAHREEILNQAYETFAKVRGAKELGKLFDGRFDYDRKVIFASVQTLMRQEHLGKFDPKAFEYIVFDEFHHAASKSYRKILEYFKPEFLLGITATPYRMDRQNVFELCDYNVVYEADLFTAINRGWLTPFYYYGIYDATVNYDNVTYLNGKYLESELEAQLNKKSRADLILEHFKKYRSKCTLGFCATIKHADYMAEYFSEQGIKAVSVHSGSDSSCQMDRKLAIEGLSSGVIEVIFSVDMFNEGVDILLVDTLLFLRPTESSTVFLQQLGRGLRKAVGKKKVRVLDFIGNYKKVSLVPFLLGGRKMNDQSYDLAKQLGAQGIQGILENESFFPAGCRIDFEFQVIDLIDKMLKSKIGLKDRVITEFLTLKESLGSVPTRMEFYEAMETEFYKSVKAERKSNPFVDYIGFLESLMVMGHIDEGEVDRFSLEAKMFIHTIETTRMDQLYKIPVLLAFIKNGRLNQKVNSQELIESFKSFYSDGQNAKDLIRNKDGRNYKSWTDKDYKRKAYDNPVKNFHNNCGDIFFLDADTQDFSIVLDLEDYAGHKGFINQVIDAIHFRRSDFLNMQLSKY